MSTGVPGVTGGIGGFGMDWYIVLNVFTTKSAWSSKGTYILMGKDKIGKITFFKESQKKKIEKINYRSY